MNIGNEERKKNHNRNHPSITLIIESVLIMAENSSSIVTSILSYDQLLADAKSSRCKNSCNELLQRLHYNLQNNVNYNGSSCFNVIRYIIEHDRFYFGFQLEVTRVSNIFLQQTGATIKQKKAISNLLETRQHSRPNAYREDDEAYTEVLYDSPYNSPGYASD